MEERTYEKRIEEKRRQRKLAFRRKLVLYGAGLLAAFLSGLLLGRGCGTKSTAEKQRAGSYTMEIPLTVASGEPLKLPDWVDEQYIRVNPYSRPGEAVSSVNAVVVHYIGNPGTTAQQNRDYFDELADSGETSMSSNFVVGLEGEVIACVPPGEVAYASNNRNKDTVSIETCHPDESGAFSAVTYESLVRLTAWLCQQYDLDPLSGGVIRHYDVTGKLCPRDFVENPGHWEQFLQDVAEKLSLE